MDMSLQTVHVSRALPTTLTVFFCFFYTGWALFDVIARRGAPARRVTLPIAVSAAGAFLAYAHAVQSMEISGPHRNAFAAGLGEAVLLLVLGSGGAALIGATASFASRRPPLDAAKQGPWLTILLIAAVALPFISLGAAEYVFQEHIPWLLAMRMSVALAIAAAVIACGLVIDRAPRASMRALVILTLAAVLQAASAYALVKHYAHIALGR